MRAHLLGLPAPAELSMNSHHLCGCEMHRMLGQEASAWRVALSGLHCSAYCAAAGSEACMGSCSEWPSFTEGWLQLRCTWVEQCDGQMPTRMRALPSTL